MAAKDPIKVSQKSRQERRSLHAIEEALDPWRCSWVDGRDDYGRDGFIQLVDELPDGSGSASPLVAAIQVKSEGRAFDSRHIESLETRHLAMWAHEIAPCTLVAVWSLATNEIRWRTAKEIVREVTVLRPGWKTQGEVGVEFRTEHSFSSSVEARKDLCRRIEDESDHLGGLATVHRARRRILLTDLGLDSIASLTWFEATRADGNKITIVSGPGWLEGDVDPDEVRADRVLAAAALLYEEIWLPIWFLPVIVKMLEPGTFVRALQRRKIVIFSLRETVGFCRPNNERWGYLQRVVPQIWSVEQEVRRVAGLAGCDDIGAEILRATVVADEGLSARIWEETRRDLNDSKMRSLVGLGPVIRETEPIWDARLMTRLVRLNVAMAAAESNRIDVVEYEGGLSRLASEKWYTRLRMNRIYPTIEIFDSVLRTTGVPDLGTLASSVGLATCLEVAESQAAQEFREWFWDGAASIMCNGGDLRKEFRHRASTAIGGQHQLGRLATTLKLRFFQRIGSDYILGGPGQDPGFSSRSEDGLGALRRQRRNHAYQRRHEVQVELGKLPGPYEKCPCGSDMKFKFCCGRQE